MPTAPGWYPDTEYEEVERYWDGNRWTDARRPVPPVVPKGRRRLLGTMTGRLAIAVGALFLLAAAAFTFLPSSTSYADCGHWFNPEWTEKSAAKQLADFEKVDDQLAELAGEDDETVIEGRQRENSLRVVYRDCSDKLDLRLGASAILVVLGILLPVGILFVGGARRRSET